MTLPLLLLVDSQAEDRYWVGDALAKEFSELQIVPIERNGHFEEAITTASEIGAEPWVALAYAGYGRFLKSQGNFGAG